MKRRLVILVALLLALGVPLGAQTFSAQIQQFWTQIRTGALTFTNIAVSGGTITAATVANPKVTGQWTVNGSLCAAGQVVQGGNPTTCTATPTVTTSVSVPLIKPAADSTTAVTITKADGTTAVVTIDTTNSKVTAQNVIASGDFSCASGGGCTIGNSAGPSNVFVGTGIRLGGLSWLSGTTPTFTSGFGGATGRSITGTSVAFSIVVGSTSTDNNGVLGLPTSNNGWVCRAENQTQPASFDIRESASTVSSVPLTQYNTTTGVAGNFAAGDVVKGSCISY